MSVEDIYKITWIDPWFLNNIKQIIDFEKKIQDSRFKIQEKITSELPSFRASSSLAKCQGIRFF